MNKNQHGFSAIIPVLIVAALAVICFAGWRLWDSSQNKQSSNNAANSSQASQQSSMQSTNTTDPNEGYVVIKEWGVRFKPVEGLNGVQYFKPASTSLDRLDFSTTDLIASEPHCGQSGPVSIIRTTQQTNEFEKLLVQFNGYYYYLRGSDSACSNSTANMATESAIRNRLTQSLNSLDSVK